ncbi:Rubredoxin-2 [Gammaproteobacteria bacterium]|nr:rubredoxin [Gammaproteobacteria bacterium]QOJ30766.1 MAG: rubredoxin [Gammaproteobacteria bacterium]CAG0940806.1 Rubredoxin-2 [Gammaproteobacteria bacterium]
MSNAGPPGKRNWMCLTCGYVYDEAVGDPARGHPPGTRFEDLPLSWRCPDCGAGKEDFDLVVD